MLKEKLPAILIAASAMLAIPSFAANCNCGNESESVRSTRCSESRRSATHEFEEPVENVADSWEFSIQGAYLMASDSLIRYYDWEVDMVGVTANFMKSTPGTIGPEFGGMLTFAVGRADVDGDYSWEDYELTQYEFMVGGKVGVRFAGSREYSPSLSLGVMFGLDYRYIKLLSDYDGSDDGSGIGFFYGVYAAGEVPLSDHVALTASVNCVCTQNDDWIEYEELAEDVVYLMFTVGVAFRW